MTEIIRCPECGRRVKNFFDHVDTDCSAEAYAEGWNDYRAGHGLFSGMRRQTTEAAKTLYVRGWHDADVLPTLGPREASE